MDLKRAGDAFVDFVRSTYPGDGPIPLHEPRFVGNEREYLSDCIDSTFVSSVGEYVDRFEEEIAAYVGTRYAVACVNATCGLSVVLRSLGVGHGDEVITQPLTFVGTCNAIAHCGASPVFVDVDLDSLGMSPDSLSAFLGEHVVLEGGRAINRHSGRAIKACLPVHVFGHPSRTVRLADVCRRHNIPLVEDCAESLGSCACGTHTGRQGVCGVFSFNGNKIITCGGGGMIVTDDAGLAERLKHLTTTAKVSHPWRFVHDEVGFNYRMPNINAALGCAQMEQFKGFLACKRQLAASYERFFSEWKEVTFVTERQGTSSNYWLNAVLFAGPVERDAFLAATNEQGVKTRPAWDLMQTLRPFEGCLCAPVPNSEAIASRLVNIPSSVVLT